MLQIALQKTAFVWIKIAMENVLLAEYLLNEEENEQR